MNLQRIALCVLGLLISSSTVLAEGEPVPSVAEAPALTAPAASSMDAGAQPGASGSTPDSAVGATESAEQGDRSMRVEQLPGAVKPLMDLKLAEHIRISGEPSESADADAVAAVVADFHQALQENYREGVLRLFDPSAVVFESGYAEMLDDYVATHLDADLLFAATVKREVLHSEVSVAGDLAYVLTQAASHGSFEGNRIDLRNTETMLLRRIDGQWKIVHIHWSGHDRTSANR